MYKIFFCLLLAFFFVTDLFAQEGTRPPVVEQNYSFEQLAGSDGIIDNYELASIYSKDPTLGFKLKYLDKNRDGNIDKYEFYNVSQPTNTPTPGTGPGQQSFTFEQLAGSDGIIDTYERASIYSKDPTLGIKLKQLDKNRDGNIDKYEFNNVSQPTNTPTPGTGLGQQSFTFEQLAGSDGIIDNYELASIYSKYPKLGTNLKQRDKNRDGNIDKDEFFK